MRIAGLSGIWKGYNYNRPHNERLPFSADDVKSVYHVREWDVRQLLQIRRQVDVGISHDWPRGIEWKGNWKTLFRQKQGFEEDARTGKLGSEAAKKVMQRLRPKWWFSAHLHVKFAAVTRWDEGNEGGQEGQEQTAVAEPAQQQVKTGGNPNEIPINGTHGVENESVGPVRNDDEIDLDMDEDDEPIQTPKVAESSSVHPKGVPLATQAADSAPEDVRSQLPASFSKPTSNPEPRSLPPPPDITNKTTEFLALDKCLPNRKFLQILEIDPISKSDDTTISSQPQLSYDKEWLAILRVFAREGNPTTQFSPGRAFPPDKGEAYYAPLIAAEEGWIEENMVQSGKMTIPKSFEKTAEVYDPRISIQTKEQPLEFTNPQTATFCNVLKIENFFDATEDDREERRRTGPAVVEDRCGRGGRGGSRGRGGGGFGRGRGGRGRRGF